MAASRMVTHTLIILDNMAEKTPVTWLTILKYVLAAILGALTSGGVQALS